MKSKEALDYFWVTSNYNDTSANAYETIEKDLKCGETCKKMLNIILQSFKVSIDRFKNSFKNEREFEMFKEWLENDK